VRDDVLDFGDVNVKQLKLVDCFAFHYFAYRDYKLATEFLW